MHVLHDSTNAQTHLEEKETQFNKSHTIQRNTEPIPFVLSLLPYTNNPLTTNSVTTPLEPNRNQTNTHQHVVTPNKEARTNHHHQPPTSHTTSLYNPLRTLNINAEDFKALHPTVKTQFIQSKIQPLLEGKVEPTKILRAINIIKTATADHLNEIMTPTGFQDFLSNLDVGPTEFKYGRDSHGSTLKYDYRLKKHHTTPKHTDKGWVNHPGTVLNTYLDSCSASTATQRASTHPLKTY